MNVKAGFDLSTFIIQDGGIYNITRHTLQAQRKQKNDAKAKLYIAYRAMHMHTNCYSHSVLTHQSAKKSPA